MCARHKNVTYLNMCTWTVKDPETKKIYAFIGTTLWSNIPKEHQPEIAKLMNDYRYIYKTPHVPITPVDSTVEHEKCKKFLEIEIQRAIEAHHIPIILTHHVPSLYQTSSPRHDHSVSTFAFATQLTCPPTFANVIRLWCCGHTHYNFHHNKEGYELVSNQFGYGNNGVRGYVSNHCINL
jgi:hypothetical protein